MNKTRMCLLSTLMLSFVALAQNTPAPRTVDLKASDDTVLKGTYFASVKPGPGVLLLHQSNRDRKSWWPDRGFLYQVE